LRLFKAMMMHAWLAIKLKHDGTGMPTHIPAALALISFYIGLSLINASVSNNIHAGTFVGLSFIAQFYVFGLRNKLIGLIIMIGIITNVLTFALGLFSKISEMQLLMLSLMELVMVFGALVNVIRANAKVS
jgi:hypothetical protein